MKRDNTIKICDNHDYKVPLLGTFAFDGAEYWCPYCGKCSGMLGAGTDVPVTEALIGRQKIYRDYADVYLHANGLMVCAETTLENKSMNRADIPPAIMEEAKKYANSWRYYIRATALLKKEVIEFPEFKCVDCKKFIGCKLWAKEQKKGQEGPCKKWDRKDPPKWRGAIVYSY